MMLKKLEEEKSVEEIKEEAIRHALRVTKGNIVEAAKKLNVGRATIYRIIDKYNIDAKR